MLCLNPKLLSQNFPTNLISPLRNRFWRRLYQHGRRYDTRLFINAVVYQNKTGIQWRDLHERFVKCNAVYQRFNRWSKKGMWEKIFKLTADLEPIVIMVDSTSVRANQVAAGQKKTGAESACPGHSHGGMSSKIHLSVNKVGRFCRMVVGGGQESDYRQAKALVKGYSPVIAIADTGYDAHWFIDELKGLEVAEVVISKSTRVEMR